MHPNVSATSVVFRTAVCAALLLAAGRAANLHGQVLAKGHAEGQIIAEAEAEAAAHPRIAPPPAPGNMFRPEQNGTAARRCVEGEELGPVRSGEFVIGGGLGGSRAMQAGRAGKVWWAPLHHSGNMPPLLVRGRRLTEPTDTFRFTTSTVAWPVTRGAPPVPEAQREYFFPSGVTVPQPGRWLVIATSGPNWGCFILTVRP